MQINYPDWKRQPWIFRQFRKMSVPLTWLLLKTPLRPNEISLAAIVSGVLAAVFFSLGYWYTGVLVMLLTILLDFSDGEVSRHRGIQSKEGSYLDKVYLFGVHPVLLAGMTIGTYLSHPNIWIVVAGFVSTISVFLLCIVAEYAKQIVVWKHCQRFMERLDANPQLFRNQVNSVDLNNNQKSQQDKQGKFTTILKRLCAAWDFPWIFCIMAVAIVTEQLLRPHIASVLFQPTVFFLYFYATTYPILIFGFLTKNIYRREIERQYQDSELKIRMLLKKWSGEGL